nr:type II secretion system F family protein [Actinomyces polynesiensis]
MMEVVVGLGLGGGIVLVLASWVGTPTWGVGRPAWYLRWSDEVVRSGIRGLTPLRLLAICLGVTLAVLLLVLAWTGAWTVSTAVALMTLPLAPAVVLARSRRRIAAARAAWPDVIDSLVAGVRAGGGLPELLAELGESGPPALRPHFTRFALDHRADGRFDVALARLKERLADPVADRIIEALRLAREVGGSDLSALLRDLGVLLREESRVRGELEARQSWTVNAARLGVVAPWLVLVLIAAQAEAARAYSTPQGVLVLLGGGVATVVAYLAMQRIGRLPTERRFLR